MKITSKIQLDEVLSIEKSCYQDQIGNILIDSIFARPGRKIYHYLHHLRKMEYYNSKGLRGKLGYYFHYFFKSRLSYRLGYQIPCGTCGKGLKLCHYAGGVVINGKATLGEFCRLYPGVIVGSTPQGVSTIGNNVWIGGGVKIIGNITVGNNVIIAPNSVVSKSIPSNSICGGSPAKVLKEITESNYSNYSDYINPIS